MEAFIGTIILFAGNYAPQGWAFCDGTKLPVARYGPLYQLIGNIYGGDATNFALPDLRGRAPVHFGQAPSMDNYPFGKPAGAEKVALTTVELPAHSHALMTTPDLATDGDPTNKLLAQTVDMATSLGSPSYAPASATALVAAHPNSIAAAGSGAAHSNVSPVLAVSYIIATEGIWPSRP